MSPLAATSSRLAPPSVRRKTLTPPFVSAPIQRANKYRKIEIKQRRTSNEELVCTNGRGADEETTDLLKTGRNLANEFERELGIRLLTIKMAMVKSAGIPPQSNRVVARSTLNRHLGGSSVLSEGGGGGSSAVPLESEDGNGITFREADLTDVSVGNVDEAFAEGVGGLRDDELGSSELGTIVVSLALVNNGHCQSK